MSNCDHSKYHSYFCPECGVRLIPQEKNPCNHPKRRDGTCMKSGCNGKKQL